jgi:hypothetical protein
MMGRAMEIYRELLKQLAPDYQSVAGQSCIAIIERELLI